MVDTLQTAGTSLNVAIVYALPDAQTAVEITLPVGSRVADALTASGLLQRFSLPDDVPVGVYGVRVERDRLLEDGDQVEIYRPLEVDPKQARRLRAAVTAKRKAKSA